MSSMLFNFAAYNNTKHIYLMKHTHLVRLLAILFGISPVASIAQSQLYPQHFDLHEVTLTEGPLKSAMDINVNMLMQYDVDRLLTPFVRQSGLGSKSGSKYYRWENSHPNFKNWGGDSNFDLSGHVGGHYLSALALAYAASHDDATREMLKQRLDYMLSVLKDCQDAYDDSTNGMYGFLGGQPINDTWIALAAGNTESFRSRGGWVPFYCQHKVLAGLRDAYLYAGSDVAKEMFRKLSDWSVNVVSKVSDSDLEGLLGIEHGGINESMADAYQLFGDDKYLKAAKRYTHKQMLNGMQSLSTTFLDGKHANTQVPKYIGMERVCELDANAASYRKAAENFWADVAQNRTVCIGGNSVSEHFLPKSRAAQYIDNLDGPESCNSNNMLKLSEMLADRTHDARYVDFYEQTMFNHILSTQDPKTGGYVYFTSLRPQSYRIYSTVNEAMWCCVGTGMENHSKYGHFIYTHDGTQTLYINLFIPSKLESNDFVITQNTAYPFSGTTELTVGKAGHYTIAFRHPAWAGKEFTWSVNGLQTSSQAEYGKAYYIQETRDWQVGDKIIISFDMQLRYEECPGYSDYIAFKYGPVLLAANTSEADGDASALPNVYGHEGRMDHSPACCASSFSLTTAPMLIGERSDVLKRIVPADLSQLRFTLDASRADALAYKWTTLTLQPFWQIHHARYSCYWYQQTPEGYANSDMARTEAEAAALQGRTLDFVATGEQQSEAGHNATHDASSTAGDYNGERYRDARANGYIQYTLYNSNPQADSLSVMFRFNLADKGRKAVLTINGKKVADITIPSSAQGSDNKGFYNVEYAIPAEMARDADGQALSQFVVRLKASSSTMCPGIYYMRLLRGYDDHAYHFRASDWTTGDTNRVAASRITYDDAKNIIHVSASGSNNVCLMLKYAENNYTIDSNQKYLVVRGTRLSTASGASYLWWLNGVNRGSQVAPTAVRSISVDGQAQTVVAWDMTKSGLYDNFSDYRPSVCMGQTIFGLTSTTGQSDIHDIAFATSVDAYVNAATGIMAIATNDEGRKQLQSDRSCYDLSGRPVLQPRSGLVVSRGKKAVICL